MLSVEASSDMRSTLFFGQLWLMSYLLSKKSAKIRVMMSDECQDVHFAFQNCSSDFFEHEKLQCCVPWCAFLSFFQKIKMKKKNNSEC